MACDTTTDRDNKAVRVGGDEDVASARPQRLYPGARRVEAPQQAPVLEEASVKQALAHYRSPISIRAAHVTRNLLESHEVQHQRRSESKLFQLLGYITDRVLPGTDEGCPFVRHWGRSEMLKAVRNELDEAEEALGELEQGKDTEHATDELGDVVWTMLLLLRQSELASGGKVTIGGVLASAARKIVRRKPYLFDRDSQDAAGDVDIADASRIWDAIKADEAREKALRMAGQSGSNC